MQIRGLHPRPATSEKFPIGPSAPSDSALSKECPKSTAGVGCRSYFLGLYLLYWRESQFDWGSKCVAFYQNIFITSLWSVVVSKGRVYSRHQHPSRLMCFASCLDWAGGRTITIPLVQEAKTTCRPTFPSYSLNCQPTDHGEIVSLVN